MDNLFKKGNYLRLKNTDCIIKVIVENPTQEDWDKYIPKSPYRDNLSNKRVIIIDLEDNTYHWESKNSKTYELVNYMRTPLWRNLNGNKI